ncbi:DUF6960 family protein [Cohnella cellulosilytica]|uniref:DUF6960 family protein n=1 Tax=Cohnella cellulosilytica TaxID=986710 RepID=A0ABW2FHI5_9BACL
MLTSEWGLYPWFDEDGLELIEPRHREKFRVLLPYGKVFLCVGEQGEYMVLQYNNEIYLVKPILFKRVSPPKFTFSEPVRLRIKPGVLGNICEINWHYKAEREMYYIEINGKKKTSRYSSEELIKVDEE